MATLTKTPTREAPKVPNLVRAHGFEPLEVVGKLPDGLAGTLYRCGPGLMERFGETLHHPFEADGMILGVRLDGEGKAEGGARIITGPDYDEEEAAGRFLYSSSAPWLRRFVNGLRGKVKNTGNTRAWTWGERVFALMEASKPIEIDPRTLEAMGERDLDGVLVRAFSAHPHRIAAKNTSLNFGLRYGKETFLDLCELPDGGSARHVTSIKTGWMGMVHDFVVTENYAVFLNCPAQLTMGRALLQIGDFSEWFKWAPEQGTEIIVVPLADPSAVRRFHTEAFWVWHFVNAFEKDGEIVIDMCRYPNLDSLAAIGGKTESAPPMLYRARLDPQSGRWASEQRWDVSCEFPRIAPIFEAREHPHCWMQTGGQGEARGSARVEVESGKVEHWQPDTLRPSEPVPAPKLASESSSEGECWLLTLCHDYERDRGCLAVLDGSAVEAGPVATVYFDQALPQTFHGHWSDVAV